MTKGEIKQTIKSTLTEFGERDPRRGCWEYIQQHHPDLWQEHKAALRGIDAGYQAKDAGRVMAAKGIALDTFNRMVETWTGASEQMTLTEAA
jgi:hypothetical protein